MSSGLNKELREKHSVSVDRVRFEEGLVRVGRRGAVLGRGDVWDRPGPWPQSNRPVEGRITTDLSVRDVSTTGPIHAHPKGRRGLDRPRQEQGQGGQGCPGELIPREDRIKP
jgi:hypothetical protein